MRTSLASFAVTLALGAAVLFVRGTLAMPASAIAKLAQPRLSYHTVWIASLSKQRAHTLFGFCLLVIAFLAEVPNFFMEVTYEDTEVSVPNVLVGAYVAFVVIALAVAWASRFAKRTEKEALALVGAATEDE